MSALEDAEVVLVSACLLGEACRYDGQAKTSARVIAALAGKAVVPMCPEAAGGLPTPRPPAELRGGDGQEVLAGRAKAVVKEGGEDVTRAFFVGAEQTCEVARTRGIKVAVLKDRSPSCGARQVWVNGALVPGEGITCAALRNAGITVISDEEV